MTHMNIKALAKMSSCAPMASSPSVSFYQQPPRNPYNNFNSGTPAQAMQLDRSALLPFSSSGSWTPAHAQRQAHAEAMAGDATANWYSYAPAASQIDATLIAAGDVRYGINSRSGMGRVLGMPNLLRSVPPVPVTSSQVTFLDSSFRMDLVNQLGCGLSADRCA